MDSQKLLVTIDDSAASERAVVQVARRMQDQSAYHILLLHMARPVPPKLLEHGGSEDPQEEQRIEAELDAAQVAWRQQTTQAAQPVFVKARAILQEANIPEQAIETQIYIPVPGQDITTAIVDVAHDMGCGTVVVGRSSFSWMHELLQPHVADKLSQAEHAFKLWVVEDDAPAS
jgi:nucleotide-binding universal stress UspA family protein